MIKKSKLKRKRLVTTLMGDLFRVDYIGKTFVVGTITENKLYTKGEELVFTLEDVLNLYSLVEEKERIREL